MAQARLPLKDDNSKEGRLCKELILKSTKSLEICGREDTQVTILKENTYIGICVFVNNNFQEVTDSKNNVRIKSGYIVASNETQDPSLYSKETGITAGSKISRHYQLYSKVFGSVADRRDTYIFGFSCQNGVLKGRSGTFNCTNYLQTTVDGMKRKEGLFYFRLVTFGSIIFYKLFGYDKKKCARNDKNGSFDISSYCAVLCVCLFFTLKNCGNTDKQSNLPFKDIELEHMSGFEQVLLQVGIPKAIINVTVPEIYKEYYFITKWARVKCGLFAISKGLKQYISENEFKKYISFLSSLFDVGSMMYRFILSLVDALFGVAPSLGDAYEARLNSEFEELERIEERKEERKEELERKKRIEMEEAKEYEKELERIEKIKKDKKKELQDRKELKMEIGWFWYHRDGWVPYDVDTCLAIEQNYQNGCKKFNILNNSYQVILDTSHVHLPNNSVHNIRNAQNNNGNEKFFYQMDNTTKKFRKICRAMGHSNCICSVKVLSQPKLLK